MIDGISAVFQFDNHVDNCAECKIRREIRRACSTLGMVVTIDHLCAEGQRLHEVEILSAYSCPTISLEEIKNR